MSNPVQHSTGSFAMTATGQHADLESGAPAATPPPRSARVASAVSQFFSTLSGNTASMAGSGFKHAKNGGERVLGGMKKGGEYTWSGMKTGGKYTWSGMKTTGDLAWKGAKCVGKEGWKEGQATAVSLAKFTAAPLQNKAWGALCGHTLQQMVTCGLPTMMREEAFIETYNLMLPHMVEKSPAAAVGLQVALSLANIAAHHYIREPRLARDPQNNEVAVRGHFGLSPSQAAVIKQDKPALWTAMQTQHQNDSKRVSGQQVMAELMNIGLSVAGAVTGNPALTTRVLSSQIRNVGYAAARETLNATGSAVASRDGKPSFGVNDDNMSTNGAWYTCSTLAMGMLQDALIQRALPEGYSVSGPEIRDASGQRLSGQELHQMGALVSGIRAACNTVIETGDAFLGKHYDSKQVGDGQKLSLSLPMKDYARLLDHSVARLSWNNFASGSTLAAQQVLNAITKGKVSPAFSSLFNNAGTAAAFGLTYKMVNQIYQAHSKVRAAVAQAENHPPHPEIADEDRITDVTDSEEPAPESADNDRITQIRDREEPAPASVTARSGPAT
ncbi:hypothetical protein [Erwinia oleae]|uniref:hypothetical protein n=1 Tax=Erwinia oleae TaxID=796334 RepID=UPI00068F38E1|nr:hypothetical protein [Erwinia oleae]